MDHKPAKATSGNDFDEHTRTYQGFLRVTKWSIIALAITMVALYFIVQP